MVLINGAEGIGTGWSTTVPNYDPREIVAALKDRLNGKEEFPNLHPYYKGFCGDIVVRGDGGYEILGRWNINYETNTIVITELPV